MIAIYDKAQWHIDAGENANSVIARIKAVFEFLNDKDLLSAEGKELLELGIDSSASLNKRMVTEKGGKFLEAHYNNVIHYGEDKIAEGLEQEYKKFNE